MARAVYGGVEPVDSEHWAERVSLDELHPIAFGLA
jgi:hypothetical protein